MGIGHSRVNSVIYKDRFRAACDALGIQINHSKSITGTTVQFHGIQINILAHTHTTSIKLYKVQTLVRHFSPRYSIDLNELEPLLGYLSFCAKVVPIWRSFIRRLFDATRGNHTGTSRNHTGNKHTGTSRNHTGNKHSPPIPMTDDMLADLHWWRDFILAWNGIS